MKHAIPKHQGRLTLRCAVLCAAAAVSVAAHAKDLAFDQAFSTKGEPSSLHFNATFVTKDVEHKLEVWRDGDRRIKRRTDDAAESYAFRMPRSDEFRLSILDTKKKIHTQIDRSNLYRIGNFTDWFDLGHGLRHPKGEYRIVNAKAPEGDAKPLESCKWYDIVQGQQATHVCWSAKSRLPMLIVAQDGKAVWRVTALDRKPIARATFDIHDEGYIRNDANQDIEND